MLGQLAGAFSLNEICYAMAVHAKKLFRVPKLATGAAGLPGNNVPVPSMDW